MQQTNFKIEAIVHDDASTDHTPDIIREYAERYPDIIKPIFETENQYSKRDGSLGRIMGEACTGKYIAFCEGDDYWIDPLKLQKQVDFLESHPDYGMVYTAYKEYFEEESTFSDTRGGERTFEQTLFDNDIATNTVLMLREIRENFDREIGPISVQRNWLMGDLPMWLYTMMRMKTKFLPDVTGVYRVQQNSACHFTDFARTIRFSQSHYDISLLFANQYAPGTSLPKQVAHALLEEMVTHAALRNENLRFAFYSYMKKNHVFTWKKYLSYTLRATKAGRVLYNALKFH